MILISSKSTIRRHLHMSCLMCADDIVLLSKTANGLQTLLCRLEEFCTKWNLRVNFDKTKIMILNKAGRVLKGHNFLYENKLLEHVNEYKYLGIYFRSSGFLRVHKGLSIFAIRHSNLSSVSGRHLCQTV